MEHLAQRNLGPQQLTVSALGLGCMGMSQGYGPRDDDTSIATVHRAIDRGVTLIDTATTYGAGHNERLVGRALVGHRDEVVLATKFGIVRGETGGVGVDGSPANARACCEESLRRLAVDHIDLFYLHRVDPSVPVEESVGAMANLVAEGKVGHLGLSEAHPDSLERAAATHPITALQSEWSLWCRDVEDEIVPAARRLGISVVPYSPLGRGFLAGATIDPGTLPDDDWRRRDERFQGDNLTRNRSLVAALTTMAEERGVTPAQLALAWLLAQGDDVVPVTGMTHPERVDQNLPATEIDLGRDDLARIEEIVPRQAWTGSTSSFRSSSARPAG
jgi:aryl-alcohol dehydrogenase-like predicted oxidoreductase